MVLVGTLGFLAFAFLGFGAFVGFGFGAFLGLGSGLVSSKVCWKVLSSVRGWGAPSADVLSPSRVQASFFYSREDRTRFAGMDAALRANLSEGLADGLDKEIIAGTNGLFTGTNLPNNAQTANDTFDTYLSHLVWDQIDGRYAAMASDLARALTPGVLELVGRSLIRTGEVVFFISTSSGNLRLIPAEAHDVVGGPDPSNWSYRLTLGGPSRTVTYDDVPAQSTLHFKYAADPPWKGNGPIQVAALAGRLSAETVKALGDEASGPTGRLLGIPVDGEDATVEGLKADIANARGKMALVETGDWNSAGSDNKVDLDSKRFGAEPPSGLVELVSVASQEVYSACGLNQALWGGSQAASVREAGRLALFGVLSPLGRLVEAELLPG